MTTSNSFNRTNVSQLIRNFDLRKLFIEELGWDRVPPTRPDLVTVAEQDFFLTRVAEKEKVVIFRCDLPELPDYKTRRLIENEAIKLVREHLLVFCDNAKTTQIWHWVRREPDGSKFTREYQYHKSRSELTLTSKLEALLIPFDKEGDLTVADIAEKTRQAFDVERITKDFYKRFQKEHPVFLAKIEGIADTDDREWYASLMLNRIMFIYFLQKKGFLNNRSRYLQEKLDESKNRHGQDKFYSFYRHFLLRLFHEGLGSQQRNPELDALLGNIPYLNGGLFELHPLEINNPNIAIPDEAFEAVFDFLDEFNWELDERANTMGNEINPDVLGYIFEKYINQKEMGAYYTKEDITEYISKNTIIPYLFEAAHAKYEEPFQPYSPLWQRLSDDPDHYIYEAVQHGTQEALPTNIGAGQANVSKRGEWNKAAPTELALPTESWREVVARRARYKDISGKLQEGRISSINDLITYNLDIRRFALDAIEFTDDPEFLATFYERLAAVTVLDPTCGSGAFLFAALNILQPLYETCFERMERFIAENGPDKHRQFEQWLEQVNQHANRRYFVLKDVIVNNLYGVDIMEEAVEIAKLRLFLKLVAQVEPNPTKPNMGLEPLPDIDFNIRAGNTLVGFATLTEAFQAVEANRLVLQDFEKTKSEIERDAQNVERGFENFHRLQLDWDGTDEVNQALHDGKQQLRAGLAELAHKLDEFLAGQYGIDLSNIPNRAKYQAAFAQWRDSHKPFHWCVEFYRILQNGGFDVIIGNPPYVEYKDVKKQYTIQKFKSETCGDLYAFTMERSMRLLFKTGRLGMIVPVSIVSTDGFSSLRSIVYSTNSISWVLNFAERPSKLFSGVEKRLTIWLRQQVLNEHQLFLSKYYRWLSEERTSLFSQFRFVAKQQYVDAVSTAIPKIASNVEVSILSKLHNQKPLKNFLLKNSCNYSGQTSRKGWITAKSVQKGQ